MFRNLVVALAGLLLVGCSTIQKQIHMTPLATDSIASHQKVNCTCVFFEAGSQQVVLSTTSSDARAVISGKELVLQHTARSNEGGRWSNTYAAEDAVIIVESAEVPFNSRCADYPDPPSHGSCFVGELVVGSDGASTSLPVVSVCGC